MGQFFSPKIFLGEIFSPTTKMPMYLSLPKYFQVKLFPLNKFSLYFTTYLKFSLFLTLSSFPSIFLVEFISPNTFLPGYSSILTPIKAQTRMKMVPPGVLFMQKCRDMDSETRPYLWNPALLPNRSFSIDLRKARKKSCYVLLILPYRP